MEKHRVIGHVVAVHGFRLKIELSSEAKSSSRATLDGVQRAVAINSFLTFDLGAGTYALGILTDLEAREAYDPTRDEELSLELTKPRRIASIQLLGTVRQEGKKVWKFDQGITVLPTLDTPAEVASPDILSSVFGRPPKRNRPHNWCEEGDSSYDFPIELGHQTGDENTKVKASFNDLFSRPLAIVGNTGSGKSYTVASLLSSVIETKKIADQDIHDPHIFVLDINGEYAKVFFDESQASYKREPNKIYLNGEEFCLPAWLLNGQEVCDWLQASEATQEPVLKDWWAVVKAKSGLVGTYDPSLIAVTKLETAIAWLDGNTPASAFDLVLSHAKQYAPSLDWASLNSVPNWTPSSADKWRRISNDKEVRDALTALREELYTQVSEKQNEEVNFAKSADAPRYIALREFRDPNLINRSVDQEGDKRIDQYLMTLKLRLRTRLDDRRWQSFFSFEDLEITSFESWIKKIGIGENPESRVSVLDFSMLASEVLPFACALIGRLLLETREMLKPDVRYKYPWVLVLEEAHNYARPLRSLEDRSSNLSRSAFERVAKEGRKFGLSLIVASQRPSEISPTIISQCANFFSHRLQNPDDIDHFRRIMPRQAQRLLDQVTVLKSGEAIVFGSAVHVPTRVQIKMPSKEPWSMTAAPFADWSSDNKFPLNEVLSAWGLNEQEDNSSPFAEPEAESLDEDIPF
jgi:hypothetical protein